MTKRSAPPIGPGAVRVALFAAAAGLMLGAEIVLYAVARGRGDWPAGHPWSGIAMTGFAVAFFDFAIRSRGSAIGMGVSVFFGFVSTACWVWATII